MHLNVVNFPIGTSDGGRSKSSTVTTLLWEAESSNTVGAALEMADRKNVHLYTVDVSHGKRFFEGHGRKSVETLQCQTDHEACLQTHWLWSHVTPALQA